MRPPVIAHTLSLSSANTVRHSQLKSQCFLIACHPASPCRDRAVSRCRSGVLVLTVNMFVAHS